MQEDPYDPLKVLLRELADSLAHSAQNVAYWAGEIQKAEAKWTEAIVYNKQLETMKNRLESKGFIYPPCTPPSS